MDIHSHEIDDDDIPIEGRTIPPELQVMDIHSHHEIDDDDIPIEERKIPPALQVNDDGNGRNNWNVRPSLQVNNDGNRKNNGNVDPLIHNSNTMSIRNSQQFKEYQAKINGELLIAEEDQYQRFTPRKEIDQHSQQSINWSGRCQQRQNNTQQLLHNVASGNYTGRKGNTAREINRENVRRH